MAKVNFCKTTKIQFQELSAPNPDTVYFITDTQEIYLGQILFSSIQSLNELDKQISTASALLDELNGE